jgi:cell division protease FtsH
MVEQRDFSEERAQLIDMEVSRILSEAEKKAHDVLQKYRKGLDSLTHLLLEKETVSGEELTKLLEADTGIAKPEMTVI